MAKYYKYTFVSPESLFAQIKMQLKSYFESNAMDDTLFPIWTDYVIRKFRKSALPIKETLLFIDDSYAILPDDFNSVREARMCTNISTTWRNPSSCYSKITTKLSDTNNTCTPTPIDCCDPCSYADVVEVFYKTNESQTFTNHISYLLKPGNISTLESCANDCFNIGVSSMEEFDIKGNRFYTNFQQGDVYLVYYSKNDLDNQLIPDNVFIQDAVKAYIEYQLFLMLLNDVTDETFNQVSNKVQFYKDQYYEKLVIAETETKKQTTEQKRVSLIRTKKSLNRYNIN
jgi:hypothetical protein